MATLIHTSIHLRYETSVAKIKDGEVKIEIGTRDSSPSLANYSPDDVQQRDASDNDDSCRHVDCDDVLTHFHGVQPLGGLFFVDDEDDEWAGYMTCSFLSRKHIGHDIKKYTSYHAIADQLEDMEEEYYPTYVGTAMLLKVLFEEDGRVKTAIQDTEKGSGTWGEELSTCNILFFERILTSPKHLRRGVARAAVQAAIETAKAMSDGQHLLVFAQPSMLLSEVKDWTETLNKFKHKSQKEKSEFIAAAAKWPSKFWRSMGFRRVWKDNEELMGYSTDPSHPCHTTPEEPQDNGHNDRHEDGHNAKSNNKSDDKNDDKNGENDHEDT
ncbi:hypothetical protein GGR57DRAFT_507568 [Xylariaceae sp. FL1272]|nr:hypothetical protein GGR57DRAFT_507568 [Xylariaceae sp. FL1272]